jgi:hypothetical protein
MEQYTKFVTPRGWLKELEELEEWNNHTERLIVIATECEKQSAGTYNGHIFGKIRAALENNLKQHYKEGSLTEELGTVRYGLTLYLRERIAMTYGPEVLKRINP